jgi:anti-anti-sigma regulatory factor
MGQGAIRSSRAGEVAVVALDGAHDAGSVVSFNRTLAPLDGQPLLVDLGAATLLDSRILAALLGWSAQAAASGRSLAVVLPRGATARRLIEIVAGGRLRSFTSTPEALAALTGSPPPLR